MTGRMVDPILPNALISVVPSCDGETPSSMDGGWMVVHHVIISTPLWRLIGRVKRGISYSAHEFTARERIGLRFELEVKPVVLMTILLYIAYHCQSTIQLYVLSQPHAILLCSIGVLGALKTRVLNSLVCDLIYLVTFTAYYRLVSEWSKGYRRN